MADNIQNIQIARNTWVDLYDATGIAVGSQIVVENIGNDDVYLTVQAAQPDPDHNAYNVLKRPPSPNTMQNSEGDSGAWAYCSNSEGKLAVSAQVKNGFLPVTEARLTDGFGNPITSYTGPTGEGPRSINVHEPDIHDKFIDRFFHRHVDPTTTLTVAVPAGGGTNTITVADSTGFAVTDYVHLNTTSFETTHPVIVDITGLVFTLDRRLDNAHEIGDTIQKAIVDLSSLAGTTAAPVEYFIGPEPGTTAVWDITRLLIEMTHDSAGDLGKFGGITALLNGVFIRVRNNGEYRTLTNWKTNGDIAVDMYDVTFSSRSGGQGAFGTNARITLAEMGAIAKLKGVNDDQIEIYVQDDLSDLVSFRLKAQGHLEFV